MLQLLAKTIFHGLRYRIDGRQLIGEAWHIMKTGEKRKSWEDLSSTEQRNLLYPMHTATSYDELIDMAIREYTEYPADHEDTKKRVYMHLIRLGYELDELEDAWHDITTLDLATFRFRAALIDN